MPRIIAMIPTYNEAENIGPLIDAILAVGPELEALVVDDDSPDGTWRIVRDHAEANHRVHLLRRRTARGRGRAGIAGFREALRLGADWVLEMDADWSHDPKWIPSLIEKSRQADLVIGSRLIPGGGEEGRSVVRRWITLAANAYIRAMLRLPVRDTTSGYRLFSRRCLVAVPWDAMRATGPEVVQEILLAVHAHGFRIAETPILFVERQRGRSSFNIRIMAHSLAAMVHLRRRPGRLVPPESTPDKEHLKSPDALTPLPRVTTVPLSWFYGMGRRAHRALRVWGPIRPRRLTKPVVCVGNLTVGGTGKTPFVAMLTSQLCEMGYRPAILSRGYGAPERLRRPLLVSDGERILAPAEQTGDEPQWLARHCRGVSIVVHPNRYQAGKMAIRMLGADLLLLDDGFQHDRLRRDLDIVLWDVCDQPERMRLLPAGRLREGLGALGRADAIILTHADYLPQSQRERRIERIMVRLKRHAPTAPVFEVATRLTGHEQLSGRSGPESEAGSEGKWPWSERRVVLISGLARPEGFEALVRRGGGEVMHHFVYPDHYPYDGREVDRWREMMRETDAEMVLTTAKDAVKIVELPLFGLPLLSVQISMEVTEPDRWRGFLEERLGYFAETK